MKAGSMSFGSGISILILGLVWAALFAVAYFVPGQGTFFGLLAAGIVLTAVWGHLASSAEKRAAQLWAEYQNTGNAEALSGARGTTGKILADCAATLSTTSRERDFLLGALKGLRNPVVVCDEKGAILHYSKPFLEFSGKKHSQIVGFKLCKVLMDRANGCPLEGVAQNGGVRQEEMDLELWNGRKVPIKFFATEVDDAKGNRLGAMASMIDTTDRALQMEAINRQKNEMLSIGRQISELAQHVASASEELSASADEQERGAVKQKEQTDTVATAMEEMTATVLEVAQNASATSEAADEARVSAGEGVSLVTRAVEGINDVAQSASKLAQVLEQLDSQSGEIGRIIGVINDIADQTNLLALNAAIEAARAGEAGRGFAVVADEVRKLAEKTMTATKEVEDAIKTIQMRSQDAMNSMKETEAQVSESTELSNQAGESLQQIMSRIEDMVSRVAQIATAAEEQSSAAEEINQSIDDIAMVARESEEGAVQAAAATRDLADLSQKLLTMSMQFGGENGAARFRESEGEMKGVLPKLTLEFIKSKYPDAYRAIQKEMGELVFLPTASYPDQVLSQMGEIAAATEGLSERDFFLKLGDYTIDQFYRMYGRHFKDEPLKAFYMRMNDIHAAVTKDQPGVKPPNFTFEDKGDRLFMNYRSKRGLFHYFEGILRGAARFKKAKVDIQVKPLDAETARAEITFL